ncbi:hypothetical protein [uncultured Ilyobacter sp.]|uniref:hypothetical protein n=1 Tax=uncultured Ilyobacter sp. TaxID=544433 RepID=UPI0029C653E9|nr:hypothetical protein [uncultured Ilyobacter sp.]
MKTKEQILELLETYTEEFLDIDTPPNRLIALQSSMITLGLVLEDENLYKEIINKKWEIMNK